MSYRGSLQGCLLVMDGYLLFQADTGGTRIGNVCPIDIIHEVVQTFVTLWEVPS